MKMIRMIPNIKMQQFTVLTKKTKSTLEAAMPPSRGALLQSIEEPLAGERKHFTEFDCPNDRFQSMILNGIIAVIPIL
jgi:hypothetical protein